jgi:hypothetical protein
VGAAGDDLLLAKDGAVDKVDCGPGADDIAIVDPVDLVSADCEQKVGQAEEPSGAVAGPPAQQLRVSVAADQSFHVVGNVDWSKINRAQLIVTDNESGPVTLYVAGIYAVRPPIRQRSASPSTTDTNPSSNVG